MSQPQAPSRKTIVEVMKDLDLCMMTTRAPEGLLVSRPMSNNRQVDYDGDSFFYSNGDTRKIRDIKADPTVTLDFQGEGLWLSLNGRAQLHTDKEMLAEHWTPDLDAWFEEGIDTPGLTLIQVTADQAEIWGREGDGVVGLG